jgi:hypothetical protein
MVPGRVGSFTPVHSGQGRQNTPGPGRVSHQTSSMDLDQASREDEDEVQDDNEERRVSRNRRRLPIGSFTSASHRPGFYE